MSTLEEQAAQIAANCKTEGWDSYGGKPVDQRAIDGALSFVRSFFMAPCSWGGVALEVRTKELGFDIDFNLDGSPHSWMMYKGEECVGEGYFDRQMPPVEKCRCDRPVDQCTYPLTGDCR